MHLMWVEIKTELKGMGFGYFISTGVAHLGPVADFSTEPSGTCMRKLQEV